MGNCIGLSICAAFCGGIGKTGVQKAKKIKISQNVTNNNKSVKGLLLEFMRKIVILCAVLELIFYSNADKIY